MRYSIVVCVGRFGLLLVVSNEIKGGLLKTKLESLETEQPIIESVLMIHLHNYYLKYMLIVLLR